MKSILVIGAFLICTLSISSCKTTCPAYAKEDAQPKKVEVPQADKVKV